MSETTQQILLLALLAVSPILLWVGSLIVSLLIDLLCYLIDAIAGDHKQAVPAGAHTLANTSTKASTLDPFSESSKQRAEKPAAKTLTKPTATSQPATEPKTPVAGINKFVRYLPAQARQAIIANLGQETFDRLRSNLRPGEDPELKEDAHKLYSSYVFTVGVCLSKPLLDAYDPHKCAPDLGSKLTAMTMVFDGMLADKRKSLHSSKPSIGYCYEVLTTGQEHQVYENAFHNMSNFDGVYGLSRLNCALDVLRFVKLVAQQSVAEDLVSASLAQAHQQRVRQQVFSIFRLASVEQQALDQHLDLLEYSLANPNVYNPVVKMDEDLVAPNIKFLLSVHYNPDYLKKFMHAMVPGLSTR